MLVMTVNGGKEVWVFNVDDLPPGGGIVVGDGNCWKPSNGKSKSQFMTDAKLDELTGKLRAAGYVPITVANKLAGDIQRRSDFDPSDAVIALGEYAMRQVASRGSFDSGHEVRASRGDISFGQRAIVSDDFLVLQNSGGYNSEWMEDVIAIAHDCLAIDYDADDMHKGHAAYKACSKEDKNLIEVVRYELNLFNLSPHGTLNGAARLLAAVAILVYDLDGKLRMHNGKPWGMGFIVRHVLGLNGVMRGTGLLAPGNPMRAALRRAERSWSEIHQDERAHTDKLIRDLIRAFRAHGPIRPV